MFNTPAMDLMNHGCHMCEDWPCVNACPKDVFVMPQAENGDEGAEPESDKGHRALPRISVVTINTKTCLPYNGPECGACKVCPVEGAMSWQMERPVINGELCTGCALCREACIIEPKAINVQSVYKR